MGLFDSIKKSVSSVAKNPLKAGLSGVTGGLSLSNSNDLLFGKKAKDIKGSFAKEDPRLAQLNKAAQSGRLAGIGAINEEIKKLRGQDTGALAQLDLANREKQISGQFGDIQRIAQQQSALRGLGNSSIGIGAILGAQKQKAQALGDVRAQLPMLQQQYEADRMNRILNASQGYGSIFSSLPTRQYYEGAKGTRQGGVVDVALPLAGAFLGAKTGGPMGAAYGMQTAQGIGQILRGTT